MNIEVFSSRLVRNRPVRAEQLIVFLGIGRMEIRPNDFVNFLLAQKASIAEEKRKRREAKQNENPAAIH
jgi:hypothetical protein